MSEDIIVIIKGIKYKLVPIDDRLDIFMRYILLVEGGYTHHPMDKGGATKYGISHDVAKKMDIMVI